MAGCVASTGDLRLETYARQPFGREIANTQHPLAYPPRTHAPSRAFNHQLPAAQSWPRGPI